MIHTFTPQLALALPLHCMHCDANATGRITCGDFVTNVCDTHRPTQRQLGELARLEGVEIGVVELAR